VGLALYLFQLGSRRQLDFDLEAAGTCVLANLNRLADTQHATRPVHDTLDYFNTENPIPHSWGDLQLLDELISALDNGGRDEEDVV
jgi:hypothetical protein